MAKDRPTSVAAIRPSKKLPSFLSQATLPLQGDEAGLRRNDDSQKGGGSPLARSSWNDASLNAGIAWGAEVAEVSVASLPAQPLALANETSRASTPAIASPLPKINESMHQKRVSTASTPPGHRAARQGSLSRPISRSDPAGFSRNDPSVSSPNTGSMPQMAPSFDTGPVNEMARAGTAPLHSPKQELKRENTQLKRELEQMQSAMLESMRRTDRFISGGQFRGKTVNHASPMTQVLMKEKEELKRCRAREWDLIREKEGLESELHSAWDRVQQLEAARVSLTQDLRAARNAAATRPDAELQQLEELHRSSRADLEARIEALEKENNALLSTAQAQTARLQASEMESERSASCFAQQLADQTRLTTQAENEAAAALKAAQRQVAELSTEVLVGKDQAGSLASELEKAQAAALRAQEEQEKKQAERDLWQKEMREVREEYEVELLNLRSESLKMKSEYESEKKDLQSIDCQTDAVEPEPPQIVEVEPHDTGQDEQFRSTAKKWLAQLSTQAETSGHLCMALCFHAWRSAVSDTKRRHAAEQIERERRQSKALTSARDGTLSELREERSRLRASLSRCNELEAEKKNLTDQSARAQELWNKLQSEAVRLRECAEGAQDALNREKSDARQREQDLRKSSVDQISDLEATIRELRAALARLDQRATQAEHQNSEYETRMRALRAQLTKEQERNDIEASKLRRLISEGDDHRRQAEELRAEARRLQEDNRLSLEQRKALQAQLEEIEAVHRLQLDAARQSSTQDKLRQMLRLQVLAPQVTVSISGHSTVDVKGAPSVGQIKKVMMDKVLPKFAQVMIQEDMQPGGPGSDNKSTEQYVQSVMSNMVTSIEEKLQSVLGNSCVRTASIQ